LPVDNWSKVFASDFFASPAVVRYIHNQHDDVKLMLLMCLHRRRRHALC